MAKRSESIKINIRRTIHWVNTGKFLLGTILLVGISLFLPNYCSEDFIKYYGLTILVAGILTAVLGITFKLRPFTISIQSLFIEYYKNFPLTKKPAKPISFQAPEASFGGEEIKIKPANPKTIEEIVAYVDSEFKNLRTDLIKKESEILKRIKGNENNISEIKTELGKIREQSKNTISGVDMELFGVVCLVIGTIYSTIPHEIYKLFQ